MVNALVLNPEVLPSLAVVSAEHANPLTKSSSKLRDGALSSSLVGGELAGIAAESRLAPPRFGRGAPCA